MEISHWNTKTSPFSLFSKKSSQNCIISAQSRQLKRTPTMQAGELEPVSSENTKLQLPRLQTNETSKSPTSSRGVKSQLNEVANSESVSSLMAKFASSIVKNNNHGATLPAMTSYL